MAFEPLRYRDHSYDPRILAAPLETMMLRVALATSSRNSAGAGFAQVFLLDYEAVNRDRARRVHSIASEGGPHGRVCSCGLVLGDGDPVTTDGHLDTDRWEPVSAVVVVHEDARGRERFAAVCHRCGWAATAWSLQTACTHVDDHACGDEWARGASTAGVRAHLHL